MRSERGRRRLGKQCRPIGSKDAETEFGVEEGGLEAIGGGGIAVRVRNPMDQPFQSQAAEVAGHLSGGVRTSPESGHLGTQVAVSLTQGETGR